MVLYPHMPPRNSDPEAGKEKVKPRVHELADESLIVNQPHKKKNRHDADNVPGQNA